MHKSSDNRYKPQNSGPVESDLSRAGSKVVHDLHNLRNDAKTFGNDAKTLGSDLRGAAHAAGDAVRHRGEQVRDAASTVIHTPASIIENMRNSPVKSAVIALFLGFAIGKLYRR